MSKASKNITVSEFKKLWEWCDHAGYAYKDNDEFWRRFVVAISVYDAEIRQRLMKFVVFMNEF